MAEKGIVAVCGSGQIGRGWAMLFASAGYQVNLFDLKTSLIEDAIEDIRTQLLQLEKDNMLRGSRSVEEHMDLIKGVNSLEECIKGVTHVQECIPESLELKKEFFAQLDELVSPTTILASSSSSIAPSLYTADLKHKSNCLVNHPINPPYIIRLIEIVPAPWTTSEAVSRTRVFMDELGQTPVTFTKEILGFGVNRIQLSILKECWHLVKEGYLSAPDVDTLMSEGLGMRYAWQGPLETCHLLADGISATFKHFSPSFATMGKTLCPAPSFSVDDAQSIVDQMNKKVPLDQLETRRRWRDERLVALAKLKEEMRKKEIEES